MLKIYGRADSINVRKVLWLADEIGLASTREDWGRGFRATDDPEFLRLNPFGLVPVIDDGGFVLRESHAILRYLAAKHGRHDLYPSDLRLRARLEAWMDWAATDLYVPVRPVFLGYLRKLPGWEPGQIATAMQQWNRQMTLLAAVLTEGGPFLMGEGFTLADIPVGLVVNRWAMIDFDKPQLPAVEAYYDALARRPPYRAHGRNGEP
jgi:glutathione S-transferase